MAANVRRSERKRRVPTCAWCTPSVFLSWRTSASCSRMRITALVIAARATSPTGASLPTLGTTSSGGASARGPSARTSFGVGSGWPAPAARRRSMSAGNSWCGASGVTSSSTSRKRAATRSPSSTDTSSSATSAMRCPRGSKSAALRRSVWRRATGVNVADRTYARNSSSGSGRDLGRQAHEVVLGPSEHAVLGLAGKLHRPDPAAGLGAIPHARAPTDQTEIGRVPIRGVERDVSPRARRHRREDAVELGEDEPRPGGELRLALDPAVRLWATHARARLSASSCNRRCASLWWTVGNRCHPPSASSSQASTSSVRLTSSTS